MLTIINAEKTHLLGKAVHVMNKEVRKVTADCMYIVSRFHQSLGPEPSIHLHL